jgi:hypothetical protein
MRRIAADVKQSRIELDFRVLRALCLPCTPRVTSSKAIARRCSSVVPSERFCIDDHCIQRFGLPPTHSTHVHKLSARNNKQQSAFGLSSVYFFVDLCCPRNYCDIHCYCLEARQSFRIAAIMEAVESLLVTSKAKPVQRTGRPVVIDGEQCYWSAIASVASLRRYAHVTSPLHHAQCPTL